MLPLDDCCTHCHACGLAWCRDERPSPGEPFTCPDCHDLEQALTEAIRHQPPGHHTWNGDNAA